MRSAQTKKQQPTNLCRRSTKDECLRQFTIEDVNVHIIREKKQPSSTFDVLFTTAQSLAHEPVEQLLLLVLDVDAR